MTADERSGGASFGVDNNTADKTAGVRISFANKDDAENFRKNGKDAALKTRAAAEIVRDHDNLQGG